MQSCRTTLHLSRRGCTESSTCSRATYRMQGTGTGVPGGPSRVRARFKTRSRRCGRTADPERSRISIEWIALPHPQKRVRHREILHPAVAVTGAETLDVAVVVVLSLQCGRHVLVGQQPVVVTAVRRR